MPSGEPISYYSSNLSERLMSSLKPVDLETRHRLVSHLPLTWNWLLPPPPHNNGIRLVNRVRPTKEVVDGKVDFVTDTATAHLGFPGWKAQTDCWWNCIASFPLPGWRSVSATLCFSPARSNYFETPRYLVSTINNYWCSLRVSTRRLRRRSARTVPDKLNSHNKII